MVIHSIPSISSGLEFSRIPQLIVESDQIVGATSSYAEVLGCDPTQEVQRSCLKVWFVDYDSNRSDVQVVKVCDKAGTFSKLSYHLSALIWAAGTSRCCPLTVYLKSRCKKRLQI